MNTIDCLRAISFHGIAAIYFCVSSSYLDHCTTESVCTLSSDHDKENAVCEECDGEAAIISPRCHDTTGMMWSDSICMCIRVGVPVILAVICRASSSIARQIHAIFNNVSAHPPSQQLLNGVIKCPIQRRSNFFLGEKQVALVPIMYSCCYLCSNTITIKLRGVVEIVPSYILDGFGITTTTSIICERVFALYSLVCWYSVR